MEEQLFKITERDSFLSDSDREKLSNIKVAIVGLGSLGTFVVEQLVRIGVKHLRLIDYDVIEEHNIQRQSLYSLEDVGKRKVVVVKEKLAKIIDNLDIDARVIVLNQENAEHLLKDVDFIFDCTDSISTRLLINDLSLKHSIPWVHGAVIRDEGEVQLIVPHKGACYQCFIGSKFKSEVCDTSSVLLPAISITSSLQVNEFLKYVTDNYTLNKIFRLKLFYGEPKIESFSIKKSEKCLACKGNFKFLEKKEPFVISLCKARSALRVLPRKTIKVERNDFPKDIIIKMETPVAFLASYGDIEFLVYKQGELVFQSNINMEKIREIANLFYSSLMRK